jgi:hypothetical protein
VHNAGFEMIGLINNIEEKMIGSAEGKPFVPVENLIR